MSHKSRRREYFQFIIESLIDWQEIVLMAGKLFISLIRALSRS